MKLREKQYNHKDTSAHVFRKMGICCKGKVLVKGRSCNVTESSRNQQFQFVLHIENVSLSKTLDFTLLPLYFYLLTENAF